MGLVQSTTSLPSRLPAARTASWVAGQGVAKTTISAAKVASATPAARAFCPEFFSAVFTLSNVE
jgi:hypothetical protein